MKEEKTLPIVEKICRHFTEGSLENVRIIGIQNLLPTTQKMFASLLSKGLNPKLVSLLGKCYSTAPEVVSSMKEDGINISPLSFFFEYEKPYNTTLENCISIFLHETFNSTIKGQTTIVMDDGGELLDRLRILDPTLLNGIIGIEQTSSGYEKLKLHSLPFPVINVGKSQAKLLYESPLIAQTLISKIKKKIINLSIKPQKTLIVGGGAIGKAIRKSLSELVDESSISFIKSSKEMIEFPMENFKHFDLIIGCTGQSIFSSKNYNYLKKEVVLISASFSDTEFSGWELRRKSPCPITDYHSDVHVDGITLVNCGFPANFDTEFATVDPTSFQITRALLVAAIIQATQMSQNSKNFVDLDKNYQNEIIEDFISSF